MAFRPIWMRLSKTKVHLKVNFDDAMQYARDQKYAATFIE